MIIRLLLGFIKSHTFKYLFGFLLLLIGLQGDPGPAGSEISIPVQEYSVSLYDPIEYTSPPYSIESDEDRRYSIDPGTLRTGHDVDQLKSYGLSQNFHDDTPKASEIDPSTREEDCETIEGCHQVQSPRNDSQVLDLDGTFFQSSSLPSEKIPEFFDEVRSLGMDIVILQNLRTKGDECVGDECCEQDDYRWLSGYPTKLDLILNEAAERDMKVYVGLALTSHNICPLSFYKDPNSSLTIEDTRMTVLQLEEMYGSYSAFAGWYLPDEPSLSEWIQPALAYNYYAGLVDSIHTYSTKPILVSPHLTNISSLSPTELAWRAQSFKEFTGVDILLWQDNAGAEGLKMAWDPIYATIGNYLQKITEMLGSESTWSVHESFNCCVNSAETETGAAYHPASMVRFSEQLAQADQASVGKKITWIQQHHFGTVDPYRHVEADRLLSAYRAYFDFSGDFLIPNTYRWITEPDLQYPDDGNEMFNWIVADPNDFTNPEWTGFDAGSSGYAELVIDLGEERVIEWIGFHTISIPEVGIHFPKELTLACFSKDHLWQGIDRWYLPIEPDGTISEYLFANTHALSKSCSKIKATLIGLQWIFISEIEIVAEDLSQENNGMIWTSDILTP